MTADGSAPSNQVTGPRKTPVFPHFGLVLQRVYWFPTLGWSSGWPICDKGRQFFCIKSVKRGELVKTSNPHINFALIASLYIKIHKFNEEKPVWHWNVCSGSDKVVNRRDGPQQGDRLDLEGLRSTPGKPQTGLFVYFRKLSSQTTNSQALGKTFYNNLFGKHPQLRNQFNMSGQMNNAQASQPD